MKEHTKEKLLIYREYLKSYLSVMCYGPWDAISVWEPFAGEGIDENNEQGSALQAAYIIKGFRDKHSKSITLTLNELDDGKYESLKKVTNKYEFVDVKNLSANEFLGEVSTKLKDNNKKSHNLFFIDPYGYTQYSQRNLNDLLNLNNSDYLIFMPTNHIYRFHKKEDNPARKFVLDLGITDNILKGTKNINSFVKQLTNILKEKANTEYGYSHKIVNKDATNSVFHLFFITKHLRGAEKFLEGIDKIKGKFIKQLDFFPLSESEIKVILKEFLAQEKTNHDLYDEIIKRGYLAKQVTPVLKELESAGTLEINADFHRKKGAFYLKEKIKTIRIGYKNEPH